MNWKTAIASGALAAIAAIIYAAALRPAVRGGSPSRQPGDAAGANRRRRPLGSQRHAFGKTSPTGGPDRALIESLSVAYDRNAVEVETLLVEERRRLAAEAKIETFINVLAANNIKTLLQEDAARQA